MSSVYQINKGINRAIEFRGLKAQYIWWLGGGVVGLLLIFALLYIGGVNMYLCLLVISVLGVLLFVIVYHINNQYGEYGLMKKMANRSVPKEIQCCSRRSLAMQLMK